MRTKRVLTILGISLLALNNINAQEADASFGSLITDRPDATESSFLMINVPFSWRRVLFMKSKPTTYLNWKITPLTPCCCVMDYLIIWN